MTNKAAVREPMPTPYPAPKMGITFAELAENGAKLGDAYRTAPVAEPCCSHCEVACTIAKQALIEVKELRAQFGQQIDEKARELRRERKQQHAATQFVGWVCGCVIWFVMLGAVIWFEQRESIGFLGWVFRFWLGASCGFCFDQARRVSKESGGW